MPKPKKPKSPDEVLRESIDIFNKQVAEAMRIAAEAINQYKSSPELAGWLKLMKLLKEASQDKEVMASPQAIALVELLRELVGNLDINSTADDAFLPLAPKFVSSNARDMANKRFDPYKSAEAWIVNEWNENKNKAKYKRNKSEFARDYVSRIEKEFGIPVRERTISGKWLNKK